MKEKQIVKKVKERHRSGLSQKQAFLLEVECLKRLKGCRHFPQLIKTDPEKYEVTTAYCGPALSQLRKGEETPQVVDIYAQINTIASDLEKMNIIHLDMRLQNICIDLDGCLHLIDFGRAIIDRDTPTQQLRECLDDFDRRGSYKGWKKKLKKTITSLLEGYK